MPEAPLAQEISDLLRGIKRLHDHQAPVHKSSNSITLKADLSETLAILRHHSQYWQHICTSDTKDSLGAFAKPSLDISERETIIVLCSFRRDAFNASHHLSALRPSC